MLELTAHPRALKEAKKEGFIPAVFYGRKTASTPVSISLAEFKKVFIQSGEMSTIALSTADGIKNVLVHDMQRDPVKSNIVHVDFYVVEKGRKFTLLFLLTLSEKHQLQRQGVCSLRLLMKLW